MRHDLNKCINTQSCYIEPTETRRSSKNQDQNQNMTNTMFQKNLRCYFENQVPNLFLINPDGSMEELQMNKQSSSYLFLLVFRGTMEPRGGYKFSLRGNLESLPNILPEIAGFMELQIFSNHCYHTILNHSNTYSLLFIISDPPESAITVSCNSPRTTIL